MTTLKELAELRSAGEVVWENRRYEATYVVDAPGVRQELGEGIPVLHLGQVEAIDAVRQAFPNVRWTVVALTCPRDVAERRIVQRQTGDSWARLRAWDETESITTVNLTIDTSETPPVSAAKLINQVVRRRDASAV
ncbi:kinase [Polymorphospora sp. NPDC051019]|uniref:kinase n=1 Tax=Polymorphospora sp. NPDC051019 TaxID=3155725 RepID=UPI003422C402